jgi:hypothetical protein
MLPFSSLGPPTIVVAIPDHETEPGMESVVTFSNEGGGKLFDRPWPLGQDPPRDFGEGAC